MDWMLLGMTAWSLLLAAALAVCYWRIRSLRQALDILSRRLASQSDDVSGLCSAALNVEQRLAQDEKRLAELFDWMEGQKTEERLNSPYHAAINLIRRGGDVEQLVAQCGISRDEAALLLRLHGGQPG